MKVLTAFSAHILFVLLVSAHVDHEDSEESAKLANAGYAIRHVRETHALILTGVDPSLLVDGCRTPYVRS
jgi:hypothetical protein